MKHFWKWTTRIALPLLLAGPAHAEISWCNPGYVCLYGDMNYQGRFIGYYGAQSIGNIGNYMNDLTSSIWNRTDTTYCFYEHQNYGGASISIPPGGSAGVLYGGDPDIFSVDHFNDTITSLRPC